MCFRARSSGVSRACRLWQRGRTGTIQDSGYDPVASTIVSQGLRGLLGLTGFYRNFIRNYAFLAKPLATLLCKDAFEWNEDSQAAFDNLKLTMTRAPVLALPNFSELFVVLQQSFRTLNDTRLNIHQGAPYYRNRSSQMAAISSRKIIYYPNGS